jgi:SpoVK/Ycf46/Vps4 family AAA+-type ATPase
VSGPAPAKGAPAGGAGAGETPPWAEELRRRYLRGESSQFVLHGNVHDVVLAGGELHSVTEYLSRVLFARSKDSVLLYNVSTGVRFVKRAAELAGLDDLLTQREPAKVLPLLERALVTNDRLAVVLEYADTIAPAGETSFSTLDDRAAVVTLHRWSLLRSLEKGDSVVVAVVENLADLHPTLVSNPRVATVRVAMPTPAERRRVITFADPALPPADVDRLTELTAGLKAIQIASILTPPASGEDDAERARFVAQLIARGAPLTPELRERADKLAALTKGMGKDEVRRLIAPEGPAGPPDAGAADARAEVDRLVAARKREIIERECFGLIEFVEPKHGFELVGGLDEVKRELGLIAENMREGRKNRCPMGLLFTGPMGTGKTFVAEAFAKESNLTAIKLKNFRSKWVGATEGNLERILNVVQAIGHILVIIDEGDRAFGGGDGDGDGGTSSRVIARIKEFMSATENRGRVLFILMTNRPDKLDVDLKRAGRLDRKIPFLYPQTTDEVAHVLRAQFRKAKVTFDPGPAPPPGAQVAPQPPDAGAATPVAMPSHLAASAAQGASTAPNDPYLDPSLLAPLVGYSNADLESVVLLAADHAALERGPDAPLRPEDLARGVADYLPSRDVRMIEYMELLAVFEASNRRMLPKKYADLSIDELQARLAVLRAECGGRR